MPSRTLAGSRSTNGELPLHLWQKYSESNPDNYKVILSAAEGLLRMTFKGLGFDEVISKRYRFTHVDLLLHQHIGRLANHPSKSRSMARSRLFFTNEGHKRIYEGGLSLHPIDMGYHSALRGVAQGAGGIVLMNHRREMTRGGVLILFSRFACGPRRFGRGRRCSRTLRLAIIALGLVACSTSVPSTTETRTRIPPASTATIRPTTPTATTSNTPQPTGTLTPTPVCTETKGTIKTESYPGFVLPEQIPYRIYLPPCYQFGERRYPILYLLHGFPFDESHWLELGVIELVDVNIESDTWPPFLMVMPRQPEPLFTSSDGGPGSYEQEFIEGLIPYIDQTYRTLPSQDTRAIAGISRGGVWALEITFRYPDLIDIVAALSPALHVNYARPPYDPFVILNSGARLPDRIFLSAGEGEASFLDKVEKLSLALEEHGVAHSFVVGSGGHDAEGWKAMMDEALDFIVMGWWEVNSDW